MASAPGFNVSPHSFGRGKRARSRTRTRTPARASTVAAMQAAGVRRLLAVSAAVLFDDLGLAGTILRRTLLRNVGDDSIEMERIVVASALYALLRRLARTQIGMELTRLRQLIETGEIATGARRVEDLERKEKGVLEGRELQPQPAAPFSTAERSQWPTTGGVR